MTEDERLMARVAAGDREAFKRLVQGYQRLVAMIVARIVLNHADRQELCQEIFLKIFENAHAFRSEAKLSTWIGCIAYNTSINNLRKKKVPLFADIAGESETLENIPGANPTPEEVAERQELDQRLQREIERLDPPFRVVLSLFHHSGMSYDEIGRVMNLPAGTVKSHLFRARQKLKARLLGERPWEET